MAVVGPFVMLGLHELTHIAVARLWTPVSISIHSRVPLRVKLIFDSVPPPWFRRAIMIAPILVGVATAIVVLGTGMWADLRHMDPYYLDEFIILNWIIFIIPSPADVRGFINPALIDAEPPD